TTMNEYRKYIEKDAALERRFQTIKVDAPTVDEAIQILKGLRPKYEAHHKAKLTDEALETAVRFSDRYITGRFLPDKAIDVMDEAVTAISKALRRSRADLKDPRRPIGSFVFLGPTGVGKTYLARTLAEFMFGDPDALIQIDMSEYMEKFTASRLIGSPPGYVGYEEGGQLSEAVRRRPYSVVLFDEIEKAHPDVMRIVDLEVAKVKARIKMKEIEIALDTAAHEFVIEKGYDPNYGARPMRRAVERYLEDPLAEELLRGNVKAGDRVEVTAADG